MPAFVPDIPYHIQAVFGVTFGYIWLSAFMDKDYLKPMPEDPQAHHEVLKANVWRALSSIVLFMLAFAYLKPYQEYRVGDWMQRVHRLIVMAMLVYMCWLIFMLQMRPDYGRYILGFLDSSLNKPVTKDMHTYDDNCELELANIWDNMDHYYLIHWVDWILASLVIRDPYVLHFWQVFDEVIELSLQHILPHFRECWWDHILMDITLSNIPAICLGMWIIRKFKIREMDWLGRHGKDHWYEWEVFHCHKKFGVLVYQQFLLCIHFANGFFVMNALLIPPKHVFPPGRMLLYFLFGALAMREGYDDGRTWGTPERKDKPIAGRMRWLTVAALLTEIALCWKYREGTGNILDNPTPAYKWVPWTLGCTALVAYWVYLRFKPDHTVKYPGYNNPHSPSKIMSAIKRSRSRSPSPKKHKHN